MIVIQNNTIKTTSVYGYVKTVYMETNPIMDKSPLKKSIGV